MTSTSPTHPAPATGSPQIRWVVLHTREAPRVWSFHDGRDPSWWNDADQLYTVLRNLPGHLRRRASTFGEHPAGWLILSGMHLDAGPRRYVHERLLARLQELCWGAARTRDNRSGGHHIAQIFVPPEFT